MCRAQDAQGAQVWRVPQVLFVAVLLGVSACGGGSPTSPPPPTPTPDAPAITCPANVSMTTALSSTVVTYNAPTTSGGTPPTTVSCNVASGASLPVGTTAVSCTVTDAIGRVAACGFNITLVLKVYLRYTKFWAFGDSLTRGEVSTSSLTSPRDVDEVNNYPIVLRNLLAERYVQQTPTVQNHGVSGNLADDDSSRLRDELAAGPVPDVLLLLEGSNEMTSGDRAIVASIIPALTEDIEIAKRMGVKEVLLATFPPTRAGRLGSSAGQFIVTTNNDVRTLAKQPGVILVDLHAAMVGQEATLVGDDGLHLTVAGYRKMAETFFAAIKTAFEIGTPPSGLSSLFLPERR